MATWQKGQGNGDVKIIKGEGDKGREVIVRLGIFPYEMGNAESVYIA